MYTMEDFKRDYVLDHFARLTPKEQRKALENLSPEQRQQVLETLPPAERLAGLTAEQIREYLDQLTTARHGAPRKQKRKK